MKQMLLKSKLLIAGISATAVIAIGVVVAMFIFGEDEAYRTIKVIETVGQVNVIKDGGQYGAYPGMVLEEGYELVTAEGSYVRLILDDDKYVKIEAGSKIVFDKLGLLGSNKTKIRIEQGAMTCEIVNPLKEDDDFIINTPNSVLAVRGTFFRVDLNYYGEGLVKTNVTTYGGVVAAQRVMSTGELVGTEVDVSAGNKVIISQINEVDDKGDMAEDVIFETKPITLEDIPDEDLIDVYFAIENGHEMFIDKEEVQEALDTRDIDIEEHISVYEKVKILEESMTGESSGEEVTIEEVTTEEATTEEATTEEVTTEETTTDEVTTEEATSESTTVSEETTIESTTAPEEITAERTTALEETTTVERTTVPVESTTESTTAPEETTTAPEETTTVEITTTPEQTITESTTAPEETTTEESTTEESTTEESTTEETTTEHVHTEVLAGEAMIHKKCDECGEVLEDYNYHLYTGEETLAATCTSKGETTYTCICGHTYTEEIDYLDHSGIAGGMEGVHKKCGSCGETLENGSFHEYEIEVTKTPTCTALGERTYTCGCGYSYTEDIQMEEHVEVGGGEASVHKKCNNCGKVIEDGTYHYYTKVETKAATCTSKGENTYSCTCGHTYTEEIDMLEHPEVMAGEETIHSKCDSCGITLKDGTYHSYSSEVVKVPSCDELGTRKYTCQCGYSYTEDIPMEDHVEVGGGEAGVHKKCNVCGVTIEDGSYHSYTEEIVTAATCTEKGQKKYTCNCGYSYTSEIAALGHKKSDESASVTTCERCGLDWVDISSTNFEDEALRTNLGQYDTDNDGYLIGTELTGITNLNLAGTADEDGGVMSLNGIELLPNVTVIDCSYNADLTQVDFSGNTKLYQLYFNNTGVESINVSGCTGLSTLKYSDCEQLKSLDVSNTTLTSLVINSNPALQTLNVDGTSFTNLRIAGTQITSLTLSNFSKATNVTVNDSPLQTMTISNCKVGNMSLNDISQLESVVSTDSTISLINVANCSSLKVLSVPDSGASVSFRNDTLLETVNLSGTALSTSLEILGTEYTSIKSLDISNTSLNQLYITGCTTLTTLNVEGCESLTSVDASNTGISALDLTGCTSISTLNLNSTQIADMADVVVPSGANIYSLNVGSEASNDINLTFNAEDITWFSSLTNLNLTNAKLSNTDWTNIKSVLSTENLSFLYMSGNNSVNAGSTGDYLTKLDLSGFKNIRELQIAELTDVTEINISNTAGFSDIELSGFANLVTLNASGSGIMELNASSNAALETINVSNCSNLDYLRLNDGMVTYALKSVDLTGCTALTSFVLDNCPQITSINFSDTTSLRNVGLYRCSSITSVDFSYNTNLESVNLGQTGITTLDLSGKSSLRTVDLAACASLTTIDISNTAVQSLMLLGCNAVTSVNVTGNTAGSMEVDVTDTTIDETYFTKSDGFIVNLVRQ